MNPSGGHSRERGRAASSSGSSAFSPTSETPAADHLLLSHVELGEAVANVASTLADAIRLVLTRDVTASRDRVREALERLDDVLIGR